MVEISAQQSKSAPESKLSYPADPSTDMYAVRLGLHHPSSSPIFREEIASSKRLDLSMQGPYVRGP